MVCRLHAVVAGTPLLSDVLAPLQDGETMPRARNVAAAASPAGPAPTMTTSSTRKGYCWIGGHPLWVRVCFGSLGEGDRQSIRLLAAGG